MLTILAIFGTFDFSQLSQFGCFWDFLTLVNLSQFADFGILTLVNLVSSVNLVNLSNSVKKFKNLRKNDWENDTFLANLRENWEDWGISKGDNFCDFWKPPLKWVWGYLSQFLIFGIFKTFDFWVNFTWETFLDLIFDVSQFVGT